MWATPVQLPLAAAGAVAAAAALGQPLATGPWLPMCSRPVLAMLGHLAGPAHKHQVISMMQISQTCKNRSCLVHCYPAYGPHAVMLDYHMTPCCGCVAFTISQ